MQVVSWVTPSAANSSVRVGTTSGAYTMTFVGTSDSYTWGTYTSGALHSATMSGLKAGRTKYFYQVGDSAANLWSAEFSFSTAPGAPVATSYSLIGRMSTLVCLPLTVGVCT